MKKRTITQVLIYKLVLNAMTGRMENAQLVAISTDKNKLIEYYNGELAPESYQDGQWAKSFKQSSELEWFNKIEFLDDASFDQCNDYGHGIQEEWVEEAALDNIPAHILFIK